ncbi:MAG: hypothetical protein ACXW2E_06595 [Nitrososphaeraceae archaeon]
MTNPPNIINNPIDPINTTDIVIVDAIQRKPNKTSSAPKKYPASLFAHLMYKCLTFGF